MKEAESNGLVIPKSQRVHVLRRFHNSPFEGHFGQSKLYSRITYIPYWPEMFRDVKRWVVGCLPCQRRKLLQDKRQGFLESPIIEAPNNTVSIDILGPFTKSSTAFKQILVMVYHFTHWVECAPLRNIKAKECADVFLVQWVIQFTAPSRWLSDRESPFTSALLNRLCSSHGILKIDTTAYHPQTNAHAERFNRFICANLSLYTQLNQKDWDCHILSFLMAYRRATMSQGFLRFPSCFEEDRALHLKWRRLHQQSFMRKIGRLTILSRPLIRGENTI